MLLDLIYVAVGLAVLIWSADRFIDGSAVTATYLGMSPLLVGMLIVGFGTSAPEMIVSAFAALEDNPGIALGNAYGSNIANIGLVLAITLLLYPLAVGSRIIRREIPLLIVALLLCFGFLYNLFLSRTEALIMLVAILAIVVYNTFSPTAEETLIEQPSPKDNQPIPSLKNAVFNLVIGLVLLLLSSKYLVDGAVGIAQFFGVSDLIIGLTVIAIGTSLPELASSLAAAKKGESDIVLGNIIGSCLFNALAVVGIAGIIKPLAVEPIFLYRDFLAGFILTLLLWVFAFGRRGKAKLTRLEGGALLLGYFAYTGYLLATLTV